jgi:hypothetical protein
MNTAVAVPLALKETMTIFEKINLLGMFCKRLNVMK